MSGTDLASGAVRARYALSSTDIVYGATPDYVCLRKTATSPDGQPPISLRSGYALSGTRIGYARCTVLRSRIDTAAICGVRHCDGVWIMWIYATCGTEMGDNVATAGDVRYSDRVCSSALCGAEVAYAGAKVPVTIMYKKGTPLDGSVGP